MKKIFLLLAAIAFCAGATLPAFAWGKRNRNKPPKAGHIGNLNVKHAKKYSAPKVKKVKTGRKGSRSQVAHSVQY